MKFLGTLLLLACFFVGVHCGGGIAAEGTPSNWFQNALNKEVRRVQSTRAARDTFPDVQKNKASEPTPSKHRKKKANKLAPDELTTAVALPEHLRLYVDELQRGEEGKGAGDKMMVKSVVCPKNGKCDVHVKLLE